MTAETALYLRLRGEVIRVPGRSAVVGRSASCDVQVDEQGVSRRHCEVLLKDDGATVRDLGSSRGTWVSGVKAEGEMRIAPGVLVSLGQHGTHFEIVSAIVHGHPVIGAPERPRTETAVPLPDQATETIREIPPLPAAAAPESRFLAGLAWGLAAGVVAGLAAVALVPR
jgi:pSer/pThr/pTyr-binding forkhead associated (FHA) protein